MSHSAPFCNDVLIKQDDGNLVQVIQDRGASLMDQFPASFRVGNDLYAPSDAPDFAYIEAELDPKQLHEIIHHLWLAGRPVPPRALHQQLLLDRDIIVSERIDIHCVWGQGRIFIKPLPRYLLNKEFWQQHLACKCAPTDPSAGTPPTTPSCTQSEPCERRHLRQCALGFLLSYVALIAHESDYSIARTKELIPADVTWPKWRLFVRELLHNEKDGDLRPEQLYADVAERFIYGELRLNRLRLIDKVTHGPFSSNFMSNWSSYGSFARDNSASIIAATAWILLILSAMQVGLGTNRLVESEAFQAASWGFTVFSMIAPIGAVMILLLVFAVVFWVNLVNTRRGEVSRAAHLRRQWRKKTPSVKGEVGTLTRPGKDSPLTV
ncbi:hypothetical protein B0T10DRAFT_475191 [Thelonectria olida]|uniref:Subtilisin-like serine protease n=1 Tax=Thelonectria olida TaxID=1576542 RepID=A0A9P9AUL3_9HYPO|nr:hypothetical protein B0T10DRAFT_475191 [Thelonectria olida]